MLVTQEPPGSNCALGGVRVDTGLDANGDGVLETTEIQHTAYACTVQVGGGPGGVPGADGGVAGNGGGGGGAPVVCNAGGAPGPAINLGSLGPPRTVAAGINDLGQIVGESGARAFLWEAGVMRDLGLGGFSSAAAMAINNRGQVAGLVEDSAGASHAALWENGNLRLLGTPSGWDDSVYAINESGQVLGVSAELVSRRTHGVVWDAAGRHDLTAPSGGLIQPGGLHAMNDRGDVVGWMESAPGQGQRAFLFSAGVITDLGTLGGSTASANAINNAGQIVGMSATASGESHTYLWQAGSMQDLTVQSGGLCGGPLTITEAGDVLCGVTTGTFKAYVWSAGAVQNVTGANALAVVPVLMNDCGQVAGQITLSSQVVHPFIWQGGQMLDLGLPAGEAYVNPMALNNRGDLVLSGGSAAYLVSWR